VRKRHAPLEDLHNELAALLEARSEWWARPALRLLHCHYRSMHGSYLTAIHALSQGVR
jgi:hypothetical protein